MKRSEIILNTIAALNRILIRMQIDSADFTREKDVIQFQAIQFILRGVIRTLELMI
jgi:hypothetical protein